MLASTIQFTNTHPRPSLRPRRHHPTTRPPHKQGAQGHGSRYEQPEEPGEPPEKTPPAPHPTRGRKAGPVPSGPNSAPTPPPDAHPRTGPSRPGGRPARKEGTVCDVSTHELTATTHTVVQRPWPPGHPTTGPGRRDAP